jgi:hypothetical protein
MGCYAMGVWVWVWACCNGCAGNMGNVTTTGTVVWLGSVFMTYATNHDLCNDL